MQPRYTITTPKSDAGVRDVDIPPHIIPAIEDHLANSLARAVIRWSSLQRGGGHLQPSTLYRWW